MLADLEDRLTELENKPRLTKTERLEYDELMHIWDRHIPVEGSDV